eukprot:1905642-Rhodomonas_salina.1
MICGKFGTPFRIAVRRNDAHWRPDQYFKSVRGCTHAPTATVRDRSLCKGKCSVDFRVSPSCDTLC